MNKTKLFLPSILLLFLVTRIFKIAEIPVSTYWDETSIGYNAYSVLTTGRDEWGEFLPLHFRAFGEFKLPVYVYSVIPLTRIFGLNALSVRLPAVIYSLVTIIFTYLLAKKIRIGEAGSLFTAFFVAVTPWLFIFSRTGYEATAGLAFFTAAIYFYLKSQEKHLWFLASTLSFILAIYSYNSFRIISPFIFLLFLIHFIYLNRKGIKSILLVTILSVSLFFLSFVPIARLYLLDAGGVRAQTVSLQGSGYQKIVQFGKNYLSHFSYNFLFRKGDTNLRSQMPGYGQLYLISLPFLFFGLFKIIKDKTIAGYFLIFMILIAPIPASITRESPHALRGITAVPFYAIVSGLGLIFLLSLFQKYKKIIVFAAVVAYLGFFEGYLWNFFNVYPSISSEAWQYGYKNIIQKYKNEFPNYSGVFISDFYGQPYIFSLFYKDIPVNFFRDTVVYNPVDKWGKSTVSRINQEFNYRIDLIDDSWGNTLVFAAPDDDFKKGKKIDEIKFLDGSVAFYIYKL